MNFTTGGVTMVAILAIWFLVFLPSFTKRDQNATREVRVQSEPRKISEKANSILSVRKVRNVWIFVTLATFAVATLSVIELLSSGTGLATTAIALAGFLVGVVFTVRNQRKYRKLVLGSTSRKIPIQSGAIVPQAPKTRVNTFVPAEVPTQKFLETGAIEIVDLAEVHEIETVKPKNIESIDEIMRRRRHIG